MAARPGLDPDAFARFLAWLDEDPSRAAARYEQLRLRMARFFGARGCGDADRLADEVMDRVAVRADQLKGRYLGDCANYFYAVARNVHYEHLRRQATENAFLNDARTEPPPTQRRPSGEIDAETRQQCLERCLGELAADERRLVTEYYQTDPSNRAARRRQIAEEHALSAENLRQRTHRLRERLRSCLQRCLRDAE